jgi:hypothetical protein
VRNRALIGISHGHPTTVCVQIIASIAITGRNVGGQVRVSTYATAAGEAHTQSGSERRKTRRGLEWEVPADRDLRRLTDCITYKPMGDIDGIR